jgi:hypothetical protein
MRSGWDAERAADEVGAPVWLARSWEKALRRDGRGD